MKPDNEMPKKENIKDVQSLNDERQKERSEQNTSDSREPSNRDRKNGAARQVFPLRRKPGNRDDMPLL